MNDTTADSAAAHAERPRAACVGITPERHSRIVRAIGTGSTRSDAALYAGISARRLREWCATGRAWLEANEDPDDPDGRPVDLPEPGHVRNAVSLVRAIDLAEGTWLASLVGTITTAARTDWKAAAHLLARRRPAEWGDRIAVTGNEGGPMEIEVGPRAALKEKLDSLFAPDDAFAWSMASTSSAPADAPRAARTASRSTT